MTEEEHFYDFITSLWRRLRLRRRRCAYSIQWLRIPDGALVDDSEANFEVDHVSRCCSPVGEFDGSRRTRD